jgi:hypothetical protein
MFVARVVVIGADDGAAEGLTFPLASISDELDYIFDFGPWLGSLDRVASCSVTPSDPSIALGSVSVDATRVIARLGPAAAAGTWSIGCSIITAQQRVKSVSATVTLQ